MEWSLKCEAVLNIELLPQYDPGSASFAFVVFKAATVVTEHLCFLGQQFWNESHVEVPLGMNWFRRAVYKDILFPRVAVHIDERNYIVYGCDRTEVFSGVSEKQVFAHVLQRPHSWVESEIGLIVPSVEIAASHWGAIIANQDTVRVDHRHDFENYSFP